MKSTQRKAGRTLRKRLRHVQTASVAAPAVKKRSRRPQLRLLKEWEEENLSPTETTDEEEEEEEEDHEDQDEEEELLTDTDGTASEAASGPASRRSQRSRPLDVDKPLLVIFPEDHVAEVLGITEEEAEEWLFDFLHDDYDPKPVKHRKSAKEKGTETEKDEDEVTIPGVTRISGKAGSHAKGNFKLPAAMVRSSTVIAGTDYDLDSEDEMFLRKLNHSTSRKKPLRSDNGKLSSSSSILSPRTFERMIEILERELHLARARQFSLFNIAESTRYHEDVAESAHELINGIRHYLSEEDTHSLQQLIDDNQRRPSVAVRDNHFARPLQEAGPQPRPIGRPPGNVQNSDSEDMYTKWRCTSNTARSLSAAELDFMVPEESAVQILRAIYEDENSTSTTAPTDDVLRSVYSYWKVHMCEDCSPRLRCFHEFIMENWSSFGTMPFLPEDENDNSLLKMYSNLQAIRFDLERVRLMLDVVRKREKIKREIIRDTNLQAEKILGATKRTRDMLSNCSYRIPDFHESNFAQPDGKAEEQLDDDDNCAAATSSKASEKGHTATATTSSSGWAEEEDRALLISVARHGIGRWTQIRQDLNFTQTSAQMSQRFSRLARHRMKHIGKADNMDGPTEVYHTRKAKSSWLKSLSPSLLEELDRYNATEVWERIALRHLEDQRSYQKRSGRPVKYPVVIPVPDHVMKRLQESLQSKSGSRSTHTTHVKRTAPKGSDTSQAAPKKRPRHSVMGQTQASPLPEKRDKHKPAPKSRTLRSNAK